MFTEYINVLRLRELPGSPRATRGAAWDPSVTCRADTGGAATCFTSFPKRPNVRQQDFSHHFTELSQEPCGTAGILGKDTAHLRTLRGQVIGIYIVPAVMRQPGNQPASCDCT